MSTHLVLLPILRPSPGEDAALVLGELCNDNWSTHGDGLVARATGALELVDVDPTTPAELLARVQCRGTSGATACLAVVPVAPGLVVGGQDLWGLRLLRAGQVLTLPVGDFLLCRRYQAVRHQVPAALADCACPVCGIELSAACVAACACGMRYHAEEDSKADALSCFTESPLCVKCEKPKHFDPVLLPAPETLGFGEGA